MAEPITNWGFCGPTYSDQALYPHNERSINVCPEVIDSPMNAPRARYILRKTPGLIERYSGLLGSPTRIFYQDGRGFCVAGSGFYELFSNGTATLRGSFPASDPRPATIVSNGSAGNQLFVVTGGLGYIYNLSTDTLTQITDADFPANCTIGTIADSYFVALGTNTTQFSISALLDGTSWDALDVAQKSQTHDNILSMIWAQKQLWLIGSKNTEVWVNTGDPDFPFAPLQGVAMPRGTGAAHSVSEIGSLFMIGADESGGRVVWQIQGYQPVRVSTHAMEYAMRQYSTVDDAIGFVQQLGGRTFYWLYFPTADATWVYDVDNGLWHERAYWDTGSALFTAHLARSHAYAFGMNLVGSRRGGTIYEMSESAYDDAGETFRWLRRSTFIYNKEKRVFFNDITFDMAVGVGTTSGDGSDPSVMFRVSHDAGKTWSNERTKSIGPLGNYDTEVRFGRLGSSSKPTQFELSGSDPVAITIMDAPLRLVS